MTTLDDLIREEYRKEDVAEARRQEELDELISLEYMHDNLDGEAGVKSSVYDGDTDYPNGKGKRASRINTPELKSGSDGTAMPLSIEARERFAELVESGEYKLQETGKRGYYGRDLSDWVNEEGESAQTVLLREGLAYGTKNANLADINAQADAADAFYADQGPQSREYNAGVYNDARVLDGRGVLSRAWDRGTDMMQMNSYQFVELMGDVTGNREIEQWGQDGVLENMISAARSPAEIETWDDAESFAEVGTYIIERIAENSPSMLTDIGISAAAVASGVGIPIAVSAMVGKSFVGKLGASALAKFGLGASMFTQMTGEARHQQLEAGVDDPTSAFVAGGVNTAFEYIGFDRMMKGITGLSGKKITNVPDAVKHIIKNTALGVPAEGLTELAQELTIQLSIKANDPSYELDTGALKEALIAGAAVGGGMSLGTSTLGAGYAGYQNISNNAQFHRQMDGTVAEPPSQIQAQLEYAASNEGTLDTVYAADPTMADRVTVPKGMKVYKHESGVLFTKDAAKGKKFQSEGLTDAKGQLGYIQDKSEVLKAKPQDIRLVEVVDDEGNSVAPQLATADHVKEVEASLRELYGANAKVVVRTEKEIPQRLAQRQNRYQQEVQAQSQQRRSVADPGESKKSSVYDEAPKDTGAPKNESLRDDKGKLRPLGEIIKAIGENRIDPEEINREAEALGIETFAEDTEVFSREDAINRIVSAMKEKNAEQPPAYVWNAKKEQMRSEYSDEQLKKQAAELGVELETPNQFEIGDGRSAAHTVANTLVKKLEARKEGYIGSDYTEIGDLLGVKRDLSRKPDESDKQYGARVLAALKSELGSSENIVAALAEKLGELTEAQLSELDSKLFVFSKRRARKPITAQAVNVQRTVKAIYDRTNTGSEAKSKPRAKPKPKPKTPEQKAKEAADDAKLKLRAQRKKEMVEQALEEAKNKGKRAQGWEKLQELAHVLMAELLPRDSDGKIAFPKGSQLTFAQELVQAVNAILKDLNYDDKEVKAEILDQLTAMQAFRATLKNEALYGRKDPLTAAITLVKTTNDVNEKNAMQFVKMLNLAFPSGELETEAKEATEGAKTAVARLALRARLDMAVILSSLSNVKEFNAAGVWKAYTKRFMELNATALTEAFTTIARTSDGSVTPKELFVQFGRELQSGKKTNRKDRVFADPHAESIKMDAQITFLEMRLNAGLDFGGVDVRHDVTNAFKVSKTPQEFLTRMEGREFILHNNADFYRARGVDNWESSTHESASTSGVSTIVESRDPERSSINQFFHAMHRAVMRLRPGFMPKNRPLVNEIAQVESWAHRLLRFAEINKPDDTWLKSKRVVTLDFETYYDPKEQYSLTNMSVDEYLDDSRFEVLGLAVKDGETTTYLRTAKEIAQYLKTIQGDDVAVVMHNGQFDARLLYKKFGFTAKNYVDTAMIAQGIMFDRRGGNSLLAVSRGLFPDNPELHKEDEGTLADVEGMTAADIEKSGRGDALAGYAKQDVVATQAIAEKLVPYLPVEEIMHMNNRVLFAATGTNVMAFEAHEVNGAFGDRSQLGQQEGALLEARTLNHEGANLIDVIYDDGYRGEQHHLMDAVTIANYRKDGKPTDVVMALDTLLTNLARMAVGSQPRDNSALHESERSDINRQFMLPKTLPDSLVIFQNKDGVWQTVGDAKQAEAYRQKRRAKSDSAANFLETVDDTLVALYKKLEAVRDEFQDPDSEAEAAAYAYLSDIINEQVEFTRKQFEAEATRAESEQSSPNSRTLENRGKIELDGKKKAAKDNKRETSLDSRWVSHATLAEVITETKKEILRLREAIKAETNEQKIAILKDALVKRLDVYDHHRGIANKRMELGTVADYADEDATVEEIQALIEAADIQATLSEILGTYSKIKQTHQGNFEVADQMIFEGGEGQDSGDSMMGTQSGATADAVAVDRGTLNLEADSRLKNTFFFPDSEDHADSMEAIKAKQEQQAIDHNIAQGWDNIPVRDKYLEFPSTVGLESTETGFYDSSDERKRTAVTPLRPLVSEDGKQSYFQGVIGIPEIKGWKIGYRVYGNAWRNPNRVYTAKAAKPLTEDQKHANQKTGRAVKLRKFFSRSGVARFGNSHLVGRSVASVLDSLQIKQNVLVASTGAAVEAIDAMKEAGIISSRRRDHLKKRLKNSYSKNKAAYMNMGEYAIILVPEGDADTQYVAAMHEVGHLVYDHSWEQTGVEAQLRVMKAFEADRENYGEPSWSAAFKEWYADQVAHAVTVSGATKISLRGERASLENPRVGSFFRRIVRMLSTVFDVFGKLAKMTRSKLSPEFAEYMDGIIIGMTPMKNTSRGRGQVLNMLEAKTKPRGMSHKTWVKHARALVENVASRFSQLDKTLGDLLFQAAGATGSKTGEKSYENTHLELERRMLGSYSSVMKKIGNKRAVRKAFDDLNAGLVTRDTILLRGMIDSLNAEMKLHMPDYHVRKDMVPQAFSHLAIESKRHDFIKLLKSKGLTKYMSEVELNNRVDYLLDGQGFNERTIAPGMPVGSHSFSDMILSSFTHAELNEFLLHEPDAVMYHYISTAAKRAAWESTFGAWVENKKGVKVWSPNKRWHDAMLRIEDKHGKQAVTEAHDLLDSAMGRAGTSMNKHARKLQEDGLNIVNMMVLAFSGIASIPELGISIARSANTLSLKEMFTSMNLREARQFGMDLGVVLSDGLAQIQGDAMGEAYHGTRSHKMASKFFIANGQQAITRASRTLATSLGVKYIEKIAKFNQLQELNAFHISSEQVRIWKSLGRPAFTEGLSTEQAQAVRAVNGAVVQFVNESSLHPSKFQNTAWMNNPYFRVAAHLKQFLWAITSTLLGGMLRIAKRRFSDARADGMLAAGAYAAAPIIIGGVAIAALTMLSVELRELVKGVDRTEGMDEEDYMREILNRSGTLGAFEMGIRVANARDWDDAASAIVPTYGYAQGFWKHDLTWGEMLRKVTPFFSQNKEWWPL